MRRLVLLCLAAAAAVSGYNLVLQDFTLSGGLITSEEPTITCDNIQYLHIGDDKDGRKFFCYNVTSPTDDLESITLEYQSGPIQSKAKNIKCLIILMDQSNVTFTLTPDMKTGQVLTYKPTDSKYFPLVVATTAAPSTTVAPLDCSKENTPGCPDCKADPNNPLCPKTVIAGTEAKLLVKPKKIFKPEEEYAAPVAPVAATDLELPAAIRFRGPGPARPPVISDSPEETVVAEEEDEERRVRRAAEDDDPPKVNDNTVTVSVTYYVLDEPGNPAAVWAAVIEGIILLVLVALCFWFFFWSPRARTAATTAADPYKDGPTNYSVSYANSSYNTPNNQRIDAFQSQPAAPPRPANSAYMDDYITDNIGAMARPAAAAAPTPASAINPASSAFQPGHQRFDSSGLVTVNLS